MQFLQTVVVVDDHAYSVDEHLVVPSASLGGESPEDNEPDTLTPHELAVDLEALDPRSFDTETIVEGFADLGMNCAVLAPSQDADPQDARRLELLAGRSDVVILDWVIRPQSSRTDTEHKGEDRTSRTLLLDILRRDSASGGARIRLICVYTGEPDGMSILDSIESALTAEFKSHPARRTGSRIDVGAARIVLIRKDRSVPVPGATTVSATNLPERVVTEFTEFVANGLLPEVALASLSAVRDQSHRLLRRFSPELDHALIAHRSMTTPADAEQFAIALVGSELAAIVAAANVARPMDDSRISSLVTDALEDRKTAYMFSNSYRKAKEIPAQDAREALIFGTDDRGVIRGTDRKLDKRASRSSLLMNGEEDTLRTHAERTDQHFSALSSLARDRRFEGQGVPRPQLQLGTLLATRITDIQTARGDELVDEVDGDQSSSRGDSGSVSADNIQSTNYRYWMCLQPLCDSVRLTETTAFPMLPLRPPTDDHPQIDFVAYDHNSYLWLQTAGLKMSEICLMNFQPDHEREVVLASWNGDAWQFAVQNNAPLLWLGNLRLDKAHKLLHSVVTAAGRIGVDEYEFFRLAGSN